MAGLRWTPLAVTLSASAQARNRRAIGRYESFHFADNFWIRAIDVGFGTGACVARNTPSAQL